MMDAVEYFKEQKRMCANYNYCNECPLAEKMESDGFNYCTAWQRLYPEEAVRIVEEWSKAHPIQTNGQKFVEVFGFEPTTWNKMGEDIHDFITDPQWWHEPYEAPKGDDK